jgi:hypothetical protein
VLCNLLDNAIDASKIEDNPDITVSVSVIKSITISFRLHSCLKKSSELAEESMDFTDPEYNEFIRVVGASLGNIGTDLGIVYVDRDAARDYLLRRYFNNQEIVNILIN